MCLDRTLSDEHASRDVASCASAVEEFRDFALSVGAVSGRRAMSSSGNHSECLGCRTERSSESREDAYDQMATTLTNPLRPSK